MGMSLHINVEEVDEKIILRLDGRLDATSSLILQKKIETFIEEGRVYLILDFTSVDYLSSAGMRVLLSQHKKLLAKKGFLLLFSLEDEVEEIIKMAGFDRVLHIFSSEKDALEFSIE